MGGVGAHKAFESEHPERDVWGDNNHVIATKFLIRINEPSRKNFQNCVEQLRTKVTDEDIRVRALYGAPETVKSYHRFFLDTNNRNAIPDTHGERRFFIILCSGDKIGDKPYFAKLRQSIADDRVIRAFYDFLMQRPIKKHYIGSDIPTSDFQTKLREYNRSGEESFLKAFVENQEVDKDAVTVTADELYNEYREWHGAGHEFEKSKQAVMKGLGLGSTNGIEIRKTVDLQRKLVTRYTFDLVKLRQHFGLDRDLEEARRATLAEAAHARGSTSLLDSCLVPPPSAEIDVWADLCAAFPDLPEVRLD